MSENTTFTQEELNKIVSERIKRAQAKTEELENRVKELEEERAGLLSTIEANNQLLIEKDGLISAKEAEFAELQKVSDKYKASQLKAQIAVRNGLPYDLAERLQGSDEESLQADAERLSAFVKQKQVVAPMKSNEPEVDSSTASMRQVLQQLNL
nr:MAG TPA: Major head protein [Caudoviricetes sp.]